MLCGRTFSTHSSAGLASARGHTERRNFGWLRRRPLDLCALALWAGDEAPLEAPDAETKVGRRKTGGERNK